MVHVVALAWMEAESPADLAGDGLLRAWSWPILPLVGLLITLAVYLRGWTLAHRTRAEELPGWRALSFSAGILAIWLAIASPIDALDDYLLTAHMVQHFILMSVAPPLLVLGAPVVPMLRGLPRWVIKGPLHPLFASRGAQGFFHAISHPALIWLAMNGAYLGWHVPGAFEATFHSENIHQTEHMCFLLTNVAFWWVVLQPWPTKSRWPRWAAIPFLLTSDLVNTMISALLTFSGRVLYPSYAAAPRISSLTPLQDQIAAGSEMWILNSLVFLIPAITITMQVLSPNRHRYAVAAAKLAKPATATPRGH